MSATIETASLAAFFNTTAVISVPGRSYEVTKTHGTDVVSEIVNKLQTSASNMLVFLPGKTEIQDVADAISKQAALKGVPVIPLHSQLEAADQQQAFANYANGKVILATNIAQTSVTIDDIDVVIDSGLERRNEVRSGVEGLFIAQISQADCLQRAGRAGRTKPGEYILAAYGTLPCLPFEEREPYATPEILRKHIDRLTLRLAAIGMDIEQLDFYHDPSSKEIQRAKRTLVALGAMTKNGSVTPTGRAMEHYPVESSYARMLVEAESYDGDVQSKLAAIIAIQEVGGIVKGGPRFKGWRAYTKQRYSDLLAQYDVYLALPHINPDDYDELGIIGKNSTKAAELMQRLNHDLDGIELDDTLLAPINDEEQTLLQRCIVAGQIDQLWVIDEKGLATHVATKATRELSSSTVVRNPKLIVGTPFDLQVPARDGSLQTLHLVQGITTVNTEWLLELAPERFSAKRTGLVYDPDQGSLVYRQQVRAGKQVLEGSGVPVTKNTKQNQQAFQDAFARWAYSELEKERSVLAHLHAKRIPDVPLSYIRQQVRAIDGNCINLENLSFQQRQQLIGLSKLATYFGQDFMNQVTASLRHAHTPGRHHAHRGWKPERKQFFRRRDKHAD